MGHGCRRPPHPPQALLCLWEVAPLAPFGIIVIFELTSTFAFRFFEITPNIAENRHEIWATKKIQFVQKNQVFCDSWWTMVNQSSLANLVRQGVLFV